MARIIDGKAISTAIKDELKEKVAKLKEEGYQIGGFEAYVTSDVLNGAGMSSSAAFEVLVGNILSGLYNDGKISQILIAQASQYAENVFFGKPCGLMDQMASAVGNLIFIDFEDIKNPVVKKVNVDFEDFGHSLCIVDTKGSHADLTDEYAAVPPEMKAVAGFYGKENLREVEFQDFLRDIRKIRETLHNDRALLRAYHFFKENERVSYILSNLKNEDIDTFLYNVQESGNSSFRFLQNVYPSSEPHEQGVSLALALSEEILDGEGASRVHGGGFAGTIQAYVPVRLREKYIKAMENLFGEGCSTVIAIRSLPVGRVL